MDNKKIVFSIRHNDTANNYYRPLIESDNTIIEIEVDKYKNDFCLNKLLNIMLPIFSIEVESFYILTFYMEKKTHGANS